MTTQEVAAKAGVSKRQLQWWDESGVVRPALARRRRDYSNDDVQRIMTIASLRRKRIPLIRMHQFLAKLSTLQSGQFILWLDVKRAAKSRMVVCMTHSDVIREAIDARGSIVLVQVP